MCLLLFEKEPWIWNWLNWFTISFYSLTLFSRETLHLMSWQRWKTLPSCHRFLGTRWIAVAQVLDTVLKPKVKMTLMLSDKFVMISWTQMKTNDAIRVMLKQNGPEDNVFFMELLLSTHQHFTLSSNKWDADQYHSKQVLAVWLQTRVVR